MTAPPDPTESTPPQDWVRTLTPEQVAYATFAAVRRGFDETEVRDFLGYVAGDYESALDEVAQVSEQLAGLQQTYERTLAAWRAATATHQVTQTAVQDAQAREGRAEVRAGTLEQERDEARSKANDLHAALNVARSELENTKAALAKAQETLTSDKDDEYSRLGDEVAVLLRSAAVAGDSVRAEAELHAAQTRGGADAYRARLQDGADVVVAEANQQATDIRTDAEQYATDVRYQADMVAMRVESDAEEKASHQVEAAVRKAAAIVATGERSVATAKETVTGLRATESELRERLESLSDWIKQSLNDRTSDTESHPPGRGPVDGSGAAESSSY